MLSDPDGPLPGMKALRAFDAAARHANFTRAAEELGIRQPAVSRYIAELEHVTGLRLFDRDGHAARLTSAGEVYHRHVAVSLRRIASATGWAETVAEQSFVNVACGGSSSELFLRPRLGYLQRELGENVLVHILHCEEGHLDVPDLAKLNRIDLVASYHDVSGVPDDEVAIFHEAIAPVCSPGFAFDHADVLNGPVAQWGALPFLSFARPSRGWATWDDWFETVGRPEPVPGMEAYDDYAYVIRSAAAGQGLALGWRNFVRHLLDTGSLVVAAGEFVGTDRPLSVRLTRHGRGRADARRCLDAFRALADDDAFPSVYGLIGAYTSRRLPLPCGR